jgi:hypothetical protein
MDAEEQEPCQEEEQFYNIYKANVEFSSNIKLPDLEEESIVMDLDPKVYVQNAIRPSQNILLVEEELER